MVRSDLLKENNVAGRCPRAGEEIADEVPVLKEGARPTLLVRGDESVRAQGAEFQTNAAWCGGVPPKTSGGSFR